MDKAITSILMIVVGVVLATMVFNAVSPAVLQSSNALNAMRTRIEERLHSKIDIIHAVKSADYTDVAIIWVKNTGNSSIKAVERCDVFFGPEGNFERIQYGSGGVQWAYEVENDSQWVPTATLKITIDLDYSLSQGERYFVKVTTPSGISDEYYFSPMR